MPHDLIKAKVLSLVKWCFNRESQTYLCMSDKVGVFSNKKYDSYTCCTGTELCEAFTFLMEKLWAIWWNGIPPRPFIFMKFYYITIDVCVPHFYDLSTLVGCWSSISIRRSIYKFLNACPFEFTAIAVSGKVECS